MKQGIADHGIPNYRHFMWPVLRAVRELDGSARISEIVEKVIENEGFAEEQRAVQYELSGGSILEGRMGFARSALKTIGALDNSERGVWSLTRRGHTATEEQILDWNKEVERERARRKKAADEAEALSDEEDVGGPEDLSDGEDADDPDRWKPDLLKRLQAMPPDAFERLAQRLLREAGFHNVEVLGKTGDGGIDGVGVYRLSLVSFPTYFQCKRYRGAVPSKEVRDFRGAMAGRGDKGLLITTGSFTRGARKEATRDGAPPIDLVNGDDLCDLLKEYRLGVEVRQVIRVAPEFFDQF